MKLGLLLLSTLLCVVAVPLAQAEDSPAKLAGVSGGLCLYFDASEQQLKDVINSGSFLVHALQRDAKTVSGMRKNIAAAGLAPFTCIETWAAPRIPYKKNHISLLVADDLDALMKAGVKLEKLVDIMSPLSKACLGGVKNKSAVQAALKKAGITDLEWKGDKLIFQKPWLDGMGTWTHKYQGPDGNAVGNDSYLGVPNQVQWITSGGFIRTLVAHGRAYYIHKDWIDARDAGSGVLLWKRPIRYGTTLVVGDNLISTVNVEGERRPSLGVISGETGELLRTLPSAGRLQVYEDDIAIMEGWSSHTAIDLKTGEKLWEKKYKRNGPDAIAIDKYMRGGRGNVQPHAVVMKNGVVCLSRLNGELEVMEARSGSLLWKKNLKEEFGDQFAMHFIFEDKVLVRTEKIVKHICDAGNNMQPVGPVNKTTMGFVALSLKDGSTTWRHEFTTLSKEAYRGQVYYASNHMWIGRHDVHLPKDLTDLGDPKKNFEKFEKYINEPNPMVFDGLDPKTGKLLQTRTTPKQINFHCYELTVSDRYHTGNRPYYFVSWETGEIEGRFGVVRAPCDGVGHFAAQGLFFARGQKGCGCIRTAMEALGAFSSSEDGSWDGAVAKAAHPLIKGFG